MYKFQLSFVHYINIYSRIVIQLNMYVKIITSSGFISTILTDFVQGQYSFGFGFALALFGRCLKFSGSCTYLSEVVVSSACSSTTRAARHKMEIFDRAEVMTSVSYRPEVIRNTKIYLTVFACLLKERSLIENFAII